VTDLAASCANTVLPALVPGEFGVVLGVRTGAQPGRARGRQGVTLIAPSGQVTPAGVVPRLKQMTVVGTFTRGTTNTTRRWC
jgi:lipoprotein-releasing system permease protein